jgi:hypothetical protein
MSETVKARTEPAASLCEVKDTNMQDKWWTHAIELIIYSCKQKEERIYPLLFCASVILVISL